MADKVKTKSGEPQRWVCIFCGRLFNSPITAEAHEETEHDVLYIKVEKGELWKLMQFLYRYGSEDPELLDQKLMTRLKKYLSYQKAMKPANYTDLNEIV